MNDDEVVITSQLEKMNLNVKSNDDLTLENLMSYVGVVDDAQCSDLESVCNVIIQSLKINTLSELYEWANNKSKESIAMEPVNESGEKIGGTAAGLIVSFVQEYSKHLNRTMSRSKLFIEWTSLKNFKMSDFIF